MFGYVMANLPELSKDLQKRYMQAYCGICRQIRTRSSNAARLALSYDMAFLALLFMSLYEPEEEKGKRACKLHPIHPRPWTDCEIIRYCGAMNIALGYYNALDDYEDEGHLTAKMMCGVFGNEGLGERKPQCLRYACSIRGVGTVAVADMALLNEYLRVTHSACGILTSRNLILVAHQSPQLARLRVVVAIQLSLVVVIDLAING